MRQRSVVVFPAPFGPRKPNTSPDRTARLNLSTPVTCPYLLVRPVSSIAGPSLMLPVSSLARATA